MQGTNSGIFVCSRCCLISVSFLVDAQDKVVVVSALAAHVINVTNSGGFTVLISLSHVFTLHEFRRYSGNDIFQVNSV
ncbi:hypothetical protein B0O99DRAFT_614049, partial [Bisporella sp. PMI_857]